MVRRKPGALFPLEVQILESGLALQREHGNFYGFALAKRLSSDAGQSTLAGHGTMYKALTRMATSGLLQSVWEDSDLAEADNRPRRRLYQVTGDGVRALGQARMLAIATPASPGVSLA